MVMLVLFILGVLCHLVGLWLIPTTGCGCYNSMSSVCGRVCVGFGLMFGADQVGGVWFICFTSG